MPPQTTDTTLKKAEPGHIPALDGLRGIAILLVLFRHLQLAVGTGHSWWSRSFSQITSSGAIGVDLFFVLSGFLITGILYQTLHGQHYFKTFYMRRFLRIFPLYYGYLFLLVLLSHPLHIVWRGNLPVFLLYLQNIVLLKPYTVLWYYTGQLWSLAVEEQFYILWPLLIWWLRGRRRIMLAAILLSVVALVCRVALLASGVSVELVYRITPCRMDSLLIGSWVALAWRGPVRLWVIRAARPIFAGCTLIYVSLRAIQTFTAIPLGLVFPTVGYSVVAFAFAGLLVMALNPDSVTAWVCRAGALRWLGRYSYGIYVLHLLALHLVNGALERIPFVSKTLAGGHLAGNAVSLIAFAASLCLAWLSYNFYEVRFLRLKRFFSYTPREAPRQGRESAARSL